MSSEFNESDARTGTDSIEDGERAPSLLDATCEGYVYDMAALTPTDATAWGIEGYDGELQDFSPDYWDEVAERTRDMIADVDALNDGTDDSDDDDDFDGIDQVTADILVDRLGLELDLHHRGENLRLLNNIASPVQTIRDSLVQMPKDGADAHDNVRSRLSRVPKALRGYCDSLSEAAAQGKVAAHRQIDAVIDQCESLADSGSLLESLGVDPDCAEVSKAKQAFAEFADWLSTDLAPQAAHNDCVGRDRYELFSHYFVGDLVDLDEAYNWARERLCDIIAEQESIAHDLYGSDCSVRGAFRRLNEDERYTLTGTEALREWMQKLADETMDTVHGTHFNVPEELRTIVARIDPAGTGGIFYTPPTEDFTRPGQMWWSVPPGQETFHTWQEKTTVFHEGVPGHHLQLGQALAQDDLNLWRRVACWNSGHGEGWALYAESLMDEAGFFEDPGYRMGYLDSQRLRAARVVLDIGVHLGKKVPEGTGVWDGSYAKGFLRENSAMDEANLAFEIDRYLGWPGQAPSYALGQRLWREVREDALEQGQSLREFHDRALSLGSVPMSVLRTEVLD
ncbi:DUF885 domain-containing protein [Corynebacterium yudongzhengii]|uniref:DUF885 domain-containing protein n=1 Tax=Corynebacterium yudongzhengii TaxID=2080740 RepID=A0A2U1T448_9CORY|nr:DUF885 domain-containing protein [Corynebacterium yudongzhengii]AWB81004.1 DUF885 domain-containing protein [Corynebacterium yudongzhengii]PWC00774.1 DUF885 domain-containing protein [Corynebacterium yudongzhengii]